MTSSNVELYGIQPSSPFRSPPLSSAQSLLSSSWPHAMPTAAVAGLQEALRAVAYRSSFDPVADLALCALESAPAGRMCASVVLSKMSSNIINYTRAENRAVRETALTGGLSLFSSFDSSVPMFRRSPTSASGC